MTITKKGIASFQKSSRAACLILACWRWCASGIDARSCFVLAFRSGHRASTTVRLSWRWNVLGRGTPHEQRRKRQTDESCFPKATPKSCMQSRCLFLEARATSQPRLAAGWMIEDEHHSDMGNDWFIKAPIWARADTPISDPIKAQCAVHLG